MTEVVTVDETRYNVSRLAREQGEAFGQVIGQSPEIGSKKLRSFIMAMLAKMEVGDEEDFPIPSTKGARRYFILKKTGDEDFLIRVIERR
jgi:hypothetical protein